MNFDADTVDYGYRGWIQRMEMTNDTVNTFKSEIKTILFLNYFDV